MAIFIKKEVCPTCNGEKTILCCSCSADEECYTITCPTCHGMGERKSYNIAGILGSVCAALAIVVAFVLL